MREDCYVIRATRDGENGYVAIDYQSGRYPYLIDKFCNASTFSYDTAISYYNELTTGCFRKLGFSDCKIYQVMLEPVDYVKYDD